jgi:hypothetical protein
MWSWTTLAATSVGRSVSGSPAPTSDLSIHADPDAWLNAAENFFSALTHGCRKRGAITGLVKLPPAIKRYSA